MGDGSAAGVPPVLLVDTVGFLHRLPHGLLASFRATLAEANDAWLRLNVVDASDPDFRSQMRVTEQVLGESGAAGTPTWTVLNKVDRLTASQRAALRAELPHALQVCSLDARDGRMLRERIIAFFDQHLVEERFSIPYAKHGVLASLRDRVRVVDEQYGDGVEVTVRATREVIGRLKRRLATSDGIS